MTYFVIRYQTPLDSKVYRLHIDCFEDMEHAWERLLAQGKYILDITEYEGRQAQQIL